MNFETSGSADQLIADKHRLTTYISSLGETDHSGSSYRELGLMVAARTADGVDPAGFVGTVEQFLDDCRKGIDHRTGQLMPIDAIGLPLSGYDEFRYFSVIVAHGAIGDQFGDEVKRLYEERALESSDPQVK